MLRRGTYPEISPMSAVIPFAAYDSTTAFTFEPTGCFSTNCKYGMSSLAIFAFTRYSEKDLQKYSEQVKLHLEKFSSKYNESNGNFEINTTFIGSTFAFLADIPLAAALNAPYMFGNESVTTDKNNVQTKTIRISRSSRGYSMLNTVYDEYKAKNLIPKDFPVKTLREVVVLAKSLDEILERELFTNSVKPQINQALDKLAKLEIKEV